MADKIAIDVDDTQMQNKTNEDLQFQDIPHSVQLSSPEDDRHAQTHNFSEFPPRAESDDDEEGDKAELLSGDKQQPSFWTFEYYQQFFDVETYQVLQRILGSMIPRPRRNFLKTRIRPNPDLYGPFWICTTLVFTTAIAGNLANYLQAASANYIWRYDFQKVTFAAIAIFTYWWLIPTGLYGLFWWRGHQTSYSYSELICLYGYSLAIYIPISILWVIPYDALQWTLVTVGALLSGGVLILTFWPLVREDSRKFAFVFLGLIYIFHTALAVGFKLYFFNAPSVQLSPTTVGPGNLNNTMSLVTAAMVDKSAGGQQNIASLDAHGLQATNLL